MKYSLITCTYNAEQYIDDYFDALEKINYDNYEIIIVDDCSKDCTYERIQNRKNLSNLKIKIFKQLVNLGPGEARNKGIKLSFGEKIIFLDVDDKVAPEIFRVLDTFDADCIYFDYFKWYSNERLKRHCGINGMPQTPMDIDDVMRRTNGAVWGKVFSRKIIEKYQIVFPQIYKTEDLVFVLRYLQKCKSIAYCRETLYYYRISNNSAMNTNIENQILNAKKAMHILKSDLAAHEETYRIIYSKEVTYDFTNVYIRLGRSRKELLTFWLDKDLDICSGNNCTYYSKIQQISFWLIRHKCYLLLKLVNRMR